MDYSTSILPMLPPMNVHINEETEYAASLKIKHKAPDKSLRVEQHHKDIHKPFPNSLRTARRHRHRTPSPPNTSELDSHFALNHNPLATLHRDTITASAANGVDAHTNPIAGLETYFLARQRQRSSANREEEAQRAHSWMSDGSSISPSSVSDGSLFSSLWRRWSLLSESGADWERSDVIRPESSISNRLFGVRRSKVGPADELGCGIEKGQLETLDSSGGHGSKRVEMAGVRRERKKAKSSLSIAAGAVGRFAVEGFKLLVGFPGEEMPMPASWVYGVDY